MSEMLEEVAPPAGAWIETVPSEPHLLMDTVAPPAGAWIETRFGNSPIQMLDCRAPRGRVD